MNMHFDNVSGRAWHGHSEVLGEDILVRLDEAGFIVHASQSAARLGIDLTSLLLMPHIADLADAEHGEHVKRYVEQVLGGEIAGEAIEFPVAVCEHSGELPHERPEDHACEPHGCSHWYSFTLTAIDGEDRSPGAMGMLQSVQHKYDITRELGQSASTDALTGFRNRRALCGHITRAIAADCDASMAIFAIDRMRAIFMQYGQGTADEIQWGFARFLETMTSPQQELAKIDDERFGVLLPGMSMRAAREWAQNVLVTFAGLAIGSHSRAPELTASAGIASVEISADWTLRQAELGLVMARAGGGLQVGQCQPVSGFASGAFVEQEMEKAVQRAVQRYS
jgi:GGDEF domain-containing protein